MKMNFYGRLPINNVSISAFAPIKNTSVYAATKASMVVMSKAAAIELGSKGVRVNTVHPVEQWLS